MKTIELKQLYILLLLSLTTLTTIAQQKKAPATYVMVAGAFHGGWVYRDVSRLLRNNGHTVFTPSLSGLAEHQNTLDSNINLNTHIEDIVNLINIEDLHNVILVGHSYAGAVIAGVADRIPERLSKLIFLDALIVDNNQSVFDLNSAQDVEAFKKAAELNNKGLSIPIVSSKYFGLTSAKSIEWVDARLTGHPLRAFSQKLNLKHIYGNHLPITYIAFNGPELASIKRSADIAKGKKGWTYLEIKTGHEGMVTKPTELAAVLQK